MKKALFILGGLILSLQISAQSLAWSGNIGSTLIEEVYASCSDANGNIYVVGSYYDVVDLDPSAGVLNVTSNGFNDIYIIKLNKNGNLVWGKSIGASGADIASGVAVDASGNVFVTGYYQQTVDFNPGTGVNNLTSNGGYDIFFLKLDSNGNYVFAHSFGGSGNDFGKCVTIAPNGDVIVASSFAGIQVDFDPSGNIQFLTSQGNIDIAIQKFTNTGSLLWLAQIGGTGIDVINSVALDVNNDILLTGNFTGTADFDPGLPIVNHTSQGNSDIFLLQLSSNGFYLSSFSLGGTGIDVATFVESDATHFYLEGYFETTVDFDPNVGVTQLTSNGGQDIFVAKFTNSGNLSWVNQMGGIQTDRGATFFIDNGGNVFSTGYFTDVVDVDPGPSTNMHTAVGLSDAYIIMYDANGNLMAFSQFGGAGSDIPSSIISIASGEFVVSGSFTQSGDFDPELGVNTLTSAGDKDIFLTKFNTNSYSNPNISACDSYLSPSGNFNWTTSGSYFDIIPNHVGKDSMMTIQLTINTPTYSSQNINACHSYTSPSGNYVWTNPGSYLDTIPNHNGCDSIITTNLFIQMVNTGFVYSSGVFYAAQTSGVTYQWYDCFQNSIIPGETSSIFTPSQNGSYALIVTDLGCTDTSLCALIIDVSIAENTLMDQVKYYPNPSDGMLQIDFENNMQQVYLVIRNTLGQAVLSKSYTNLTRMNVELPEEPGIYFLELENDKGEKGFFKVLRK